MPKVNDPAMLVDQSLCVGCDACTVVCKLIYDLPWGVNRTEIDTTETGNFPEVSRNNKKRACMHCKDAACVAACPTGACHKNDLDLTVINNDLCVECNYCVTNCPFGAIRFNRSTGHIAKCTMCASRIEEGQQPFCTEVCTSRIIKFGEREVMLRKALERAEKLREQGYEDARVYGEGEMGGLRVITVLSESPEKYDLPVDPQLSVGMRLWNALPLTPTVLVIAGVLLGINHFKSRNVQDKLKEVQKSKK